MCVDQLMLSEWLCNLRMRVLVGRERRKRGRKVIIYFTIMETAASTNRYGAPAGRYIPLF